MSVDAFLLGGNPEVDAIFGTVQMVCNGQTFPVVMGESRKSYEGALGGLESSAQLVVTAQPRHVSNVDAMLQKRCTVDGVEYRVAEVTPQNTVAIHFTLGDPSESR